MSSDLRQFLIDTFDSRRTNQLPRRIARDIPIQIDDMDDSDNITQFVNIFCVVKSSKIMHIELTGKFPITREMADLAEIYDGSFDKFSAKLTFNLTCKQINALSDLAGMIKKTTQLGPMVNNNQWYQISARTIGSIIRFVRIIKSYESS